MSPDDRLREFICMFFGVVAVFLEDKSSLRDKLGQSSKLNKATIIGLIFDKRLKNLTVHT